MCLRADSFYVRSKAGLLQQRKAGFLQIPLLESAAASKAAVWFSTHDNKTLIKERYMPKPALFAVAILRSSGARRLFDATRQCSAPNTRYSAEPTRHAVSPQSGI